MSIAHVSDLKLNMIQHSLIWDHPWKQYHYFLAYMLNVSVSDTKFSTTKKHKYVFQNDAVRHNIFNYKYQRQQFLELWWKYKSIVTWTSQRLVTDKNLETNFKIPLRKNLEKRNLLLLSAVGDTKLRFMKLSGLIGSTERPGNWTFNLQEKSLLIICLRCEKEYLATDFVCWPLSTHRLDPLSTISHPSWSDHPPFLHLYIVFIFTFLSKQRFVC